MNHTVAARKIKVIANPGLQPGLLRFVPYRAGKPRVQVVVISWLYGCFLENQKTLLYPPAGTAWPDADGDPQLERGENGCLKFNTNQVIHLLQPLLIPPAGPA